MFGSALGEVVPRRNGKDGEWNAMTWQAGVPGEIDGTSGAHHIGVLFRLQQMHVLVQRLWFFFCNLLATESGQSSARDRIHGRTHGFALPPPPPRASVVGARLAGWPVLQLPEGEER